MDDVNIVGNTFKVKVQNGWEDIACLWISVIGTAGVGKTPDLKLILKPLMSLNSQEIKRHQQKTKEFAKYKGLSKEEKDINETVEPPQKSQMIVDDITMESLIDMHSNNPKSIGIFKDELAGWFKDQNKYREGSDTERFLSSWSGDSIVLNRKTAEDAFVEFPFMPILGGIQPSIFKQFQTEENAANGFMDRMLFCNPNKIAEHPTRDEISQDVIDGYRDRIFKIKNTIDSSFTNIKDGTIESYILELTDEAKDEFFIRHCEIKDLINSDNEIHYYTGMYAKQITYIPRFALLIEFLDCISRDEKPKCISVESIKKAIKLSDYFIGMAKVNKRDNIVNSKMKDVINNMKGKPNKDIAIKLKEAFPKSTAKTIAEIMDVSRQMVYNYFK